MTYVAYKKADYAHALSRSDTDVQMYLFETFGGSGEDGVDGEAPRAARRGRRRWRATAAWATMPWE